MKPKNARAINQGNKKHKFPAPFREQQAGMQNESTGNTVTGCRAGLPACRFWRLIAASSRSGKV
jgi:hypothetical protein